MPDLQGGKSLSDRCGKMGTGARARLVQVKEGQVKHRGLCWWQQPGTGPAPHVPRPFCEPGPLLAAPHASTSCAHVPAFTLPRKLLLKQCLEANGMPLTHALLVRCWPRAYSTMPTPLRHPPVCGYERQAHGQRLHVGSPPALTTAGQHKRVDGLGGDRVGEGVGETVRLQWVRAIRHVWALRSEDALRRGSVRCNSHRV